MMRTDRRSASPFRMRRILGALLALAGPMTVAAARGADLPPRVSVDQGTLEGRRVRLNDSMLLEFQGIPYAAPPLGELRWKPPQPVASWQGVRKATRFAARCMQLPLFGDMVFRSNGMSEDCLYLNVWTPARDAQAALPVLVYFYGGGFAGGDGSENRYDGASLASRGIVTVTINYRLGVFGFLALPELAAESPAHASGNYGLLDQNAALRWVKANIARFGGDPKRITIGGESAGSISVNAHMASPMSRGLIAGAIGESGALIAPIAPQPQAEAQKQGTAFMRKAGATTLAALRAMPAAALLAASAAPAQEMDPDIDGLFLTEPPAATFARGDQAGVPLLLGSNTQEGFYPNLLGKLPPTPANYRAAITRIFGDQADRALALYPGRDQAQVERSATDLAGDLFIAHSTWRWMDLQRRTADAPVYFYLFARPRPAKRHPSPGERPDPGAVHSGEIEYALGNLDSNPVYAWTPADHKVSRVFEGYVEHFIKTGNPNGHGLPAWPAVSKAGGPVARQRIDVDTRTVHDTGAARQAFLQSFLATHPAIELP
ncbi:carboxylesterase/lipase family protein [Frateuria terrea]|uniref:Carboxylic ester hydrolase n=1 Tax=Frateuria terrea TaxID=529704 RepID=A0A1H6XWN9_9GAMM|nr:carboxylesterase family protein [Frateuria terrea]SEJ32586.1 para-nitrobenzyl esterase [Frateuria terrea]SFP51376.1 para-nitrobenzyl esterase [Frateuria terrea]